VDADPEWYPGKNYRKRAGPQAVLQGKKRKQVAKSAMNLKKEGAEPTYAAIAARCPAAVVNPDTGRCWARRAPAPAPPRNFKDPRGAR